MKLSWMELLIKGIPEGFLDVLAVYVLTRTKIDIKKYITMSLIFIVLIYLVRLLPISNGVNTILALLILVALFVFIPKVEPAKIIISTVVVAILLIISETINGAILFSIFGEETTRSFFENPLSRSISGTPSTVIFALFILISHLILSKRGKAKGVKNGEISKKNS
jgi:hypothetical protein